MDDDLTKKRLTAAYKLGYGRARVDAMHEQLFYDPEYVQLARAKAWLRHDRGKIKLTEDQADFILPEGWPPGTDEDTEVEQFVLERFPSAGTVYGDEPDDL